MSYSITYYITVLVLFTITSLLFSLLINKILLKFSKSLGVKGTNGVEIVRWETLSKPTLGGISFYIIFLLAIVSYSIFFDINQSFLNKQFVGLLLASTLGFLIGLADDAYGTKPRLKFTGQIVCSLILISSGIYIDLSSNIWINYFFTVFWVIGIMNSINMLDNMDGITTIISMMIVAAAITLIFLYSDFNNIHIFILLGTLSALGGFLYYNWNPSKMYMGDTGSQFLGAFLAAIGIIYFWNAKIINGNLTDVKQFFIPILIFIVPIVDTTSVVINRLLRGHSPFVGGKDHSTHHLAYFGLSQKQVALILAGITLISTGIMVLIVKYIVTWDYTITTISVLYILCITIGIYAITLFNKESGKFQFKLKNRSLTIPDKFFSTGSEEITELNQNQSSLQSVKSRLNN